MRGLMEANRCGTLAACLAIAAPCAFAGQQPPSQFNQPGNILISDQFNNRILEVTRAGRIAWSFGSGGAAQCTAGTGTVIAPNDAERLAGGSTLIAGTGTGTCPDNRVIVVDASGNITYQYGQAGVAGSGHNQLNVPVFAIQLPNSNYLITDQGNKRIIEVDAQQNVVWSYGPSSGPGALNSPNSAELLENGDILIADENNNRCFEIDPSQNNKIVFRYHRGLNTVAFASRLPNGDTLIADSGHNSIVEISPAQSVVFRYKTNLGGKSNPTPNPSGVVRLADGNTLIADQFNDRVIMISPQKRIIFQYGQINVPGGGDGQLNAPYSAVSIGDYTGLTPPPGL